MFYTFLRKKYTTIAVQAEVFNRYGKMCTLGNMQYDPYFLTRKNFNPQKI